MTHMWIWIKSRYLPSAYSNICFIDVSMHNDAYKKGIYKLHTDVRLQRINPI